MKRLSTSEIKSILFGVLSSDGCVIGARFDLFTKSEQYALYVKSVLENIPNLSVKMYIKKDKRSESYSGYRIYTSNHEYFAKLRKIFYSDRKILSKYICDRLGILGLANIWMCDGYMEHRKNRKKNKVQNIGYFCLESFPKDELAHLIKTLSEYGIESSLEKVEWGFGYRIRIGKDLQKLSSLIYPHMVKDFEYKTLLYYKNGTKNTDVSLPNAEQYLRYYLDTEDIVRHSW